MRSLAPAAAGFAPVAVQPDSDAAGRVSETLPVIEAEADGVRLRIPTNATRYTVISVLGSSAVARDKVGSEREGKIDPRSRAEAAVGEAIARVASYAAVRPKVAIRHNINRMIETSDTNGPI
ncbi:MAG: hypothetical protein WAN43_12705 [Rhodomicrobium sp.]|jgi:hypothetical protein